MPSGRGERLLLLSSCVKHASDFLYSHAPTSWALMTLGELPCPGSAVPTDSKELASEYTFHIQTN